jgi:leader peptidase (prepilin peptidase) / N-methyltransferase
MLDLAMAAPFVLAGVVGLLFGSFLNVVAYRLPLGKSLVKPRSACPGCDTPVRPYDNVPVVSWLLLGGKCRSCKAPIAARYPAVEAGTAALWLLVTAVHLDDPAKLALGLVLVTLLVPMALIDLEHRIIPNKLTAFGAVAALAIVLALDAGSLTEHLAAAAIAFGFFMAANLVNPAGMGMGDVKLAGMLGLFLGKAVAPALFIGLVAGVVVGAIIMARSGVAAGRKKGVPFGPFLALGGIVALLAGDGLIDLYWSIVGA